MGAYHLYACVGPVLEFVDQLTNWYIRLNRRRFWAGNTAEEQLDKNHAYTTLHSVLLMFSRVLAPLAPFITEEIFKNLSAELKNLKAESVHLTPFPKLSELKGVEIDSALEEAMELFEEVILLGRGLRNDHGLKVRQTLQKITVIHPEAKSLEGVKEFDSYICEELNIKEVCYTTEEDQYVELTAKLNTKELGKVLGPKLGSGGMKELRQFAEALSGEDIAKIETGQKLNFKDIALGSGDILISRKCKSEDDATATSGRITVVLDTQLTPELRMEGLAREFVNRVQRLRKDLDFHVSDRIVISYMTACAKISMAVSEHDEYVKKETLSVDLIEASSEEELSIDQSLKTEPSIQEIDGQSVVMSLKVIQS